MAERERPAPVPRAVPSTAGWSREREVLDALVTISLQLDYLIKLVEAIERGQ